MFRMTMPSLEELLVSTNLVSPPQLAAAQHDAEQRRRPLAQTLIDLGLVDERRFAEWMADVTKLPLVDPLSPDMVHEVERYVSRAVAREYEVVPIDVEADEMTVAMVNPLDTTCLNVLHATTGMKIHPVVGVHGQVKTLVDHFYPADEPASGAFDPSATMVAPAKAPFEFGTETLLRSASAPLEFDESIGSETRILPVEPLPPQAEIEPGAAPADPAPPLPAAEGEPQLDRIERSLIDLIRHVESLHRRIEAIDQTLARILTRR